MVMNLVDPSFCTRKGERLLRQGKPEAEVWLRGAIQRCRELGQTSTVFEWTMKARELKPLEMLLELLRGKGTPEALVEAGEIMSDYEEVKREQKMLQEEVYAEVMAELQARREQNEEWTGGSGGAQGGSRKDAVKRKKKKRKKGKNGSGGGVEVGGAPAAATAVAELMRPKSPLWKRVSRMQRRWKRSMCVPFVWMT